MYYLNNDIFYIVMEMGVMFIIIMGYFCKIKLFNNRIIIIKSEKWIYLRWVFIYFCWCLVSKYLNICMLLIKGYDR